MINTAIVILNWNGKTFLHNFLPQLLAYTPKDNVDIYVADNGSTDDSVSFLKEQFTDIKIIILDKNYGFTTGYNKALGQIDANYYLLLNSDVEVTDNWLPPLLEVVEKDKKVACCMPKILNYHNKKQFEYAGAAGGFIDKFGFPFCRGRIVNSFEEDDGQYDQEQEIFWASGACMLIRANLFKNLKGFDDRFFAHMEEIDLCWRLKNLGYKICFTPKSKVYHIGGGTLPNNTPQKHYFNFRNGLALLYKNLPYRKMSKKIIMRMIMDGCIALIFLVRLQFPLFVVVIKAHLHFYQWLPQLRTERKELLKHVVTNKHKEIYNKSILWSFYFKNLKHFKNINIR